MKDFISICFFDIELVHDAHACRSGARGFGNPPDALRQYCHVPAVSLCVSASGSLDLMKHSPDDSLYTPDTNPKQSQHQQFSPTKAPL